MFTLEPAHEWKHARMIFEGASTKSKANFARVGNPPKKLTTWGKTKPLSSPKVGFETGQPKVKGLLSRTRKIMRTKVKEKV
jgi:hypothetical protein